MGAMTRWREGGTASSCKLCLLKKVVKTKHTHTKRKNHSHHKTKQISNPQTLYCCPEQISIFKVSVSIVSLALPMSYMNLF